MRRTHAPFLSTMLFAVAAPLFIVIATAFVALPYSLSGHAGEAGLTAASSTTYHLS
ncbi:MAG: hypothetical protein M0P95_02305 [Sulfuritalea sp.]|jgi:hypothetical protein|nr:hypothetical protein [Sulfuritalea sp.]